MNAVDEEDDAEARRLRRERDALLEQALPYLVEARHLTENDISAPSGYEFDHSARRCRSMETGQFAPTIRCSSEAASVCNALFQVYAQLSRTDEANEAGECAGIDMN